MIGQPCRGTASNQRLGQAVVPAGTMFASPSVSVGDTHSCGLLTDATVTCWGADEVGQSTPLAATFTQLSAGDLHPCGVRTDATFSCWGDNAYGRATPPTVTTASEQ